MLLAGIFQRGDRLRRRQEIHRHVAATAQGRLELLQRKEDFAVVIARMLLRLDVNRPHQAAILPCGEIRPGTNVRVIEAKARWPRLEGDAAAAVRWDEWRALFGCSVYFGRHELSMPVQLLRRVRVVMDLDRDCSALL